MLDISFILLLTYLTTQKAKTIVNVGILTFYKLQFYLISHSIKHCRDLK